MRPRARSLLVSSLALGLALVAPRPAGADTKVYTNKDLPPSGDKASDEAPPPKADAPAKPAKGDAAKPKAPAKGKTVTNADLDPSQGNLSYTDPKDDVSYENQPPDERKDAKEQARRAAKIRDLKERYQKLRKRQEQIEAELPDAREAARNEVGEGYAIINGVPTKVIGQELMPNGQYHRHLQDLEAELAKVEGEIDDIETAARQFGLGRPGLMQR